MKKTIDDWVKVKYRGDGSGYVPGWTVLLYYDDDFAGPVFYIVESQMAHEAIAQEYADRLRSALRHFARAVQDGEVEL